MIYACGTCTVGYFNLVFLNGKYSNVLFFMYLIPIEINNDYILLIIL